MVVVTTTTKTTTTTIITNCNKAHNIELQQATLFTTQCIGL